MPMSMLRREFGKLQKLVFASLAVLASHACSFTDPGWHYSCAGAKAVRDDGTRYEFDVGPGLVARIHVSFFASTLSVQLDVKNTGSTKVVHCTYRTRTETLCSDG
jgi:hypothetical protein